MKNGVNCEKFPPTKYKQSCGKIFEDCIIFGLSQVNKLTTLPPIPRINIDNNYLCVPNVVLSNIKILNIVLLGERVKMDNGGACIRFPKHFWTRLRLGR